MAREADAMRDFPSSAWNGKGEDGGLTQRLLGLRPVVCEARDQIVGALSGSDAPAADLGAEAIATALKLMDEIYRLPGQVVAAREAQGRLDTLVAGAARNLRAERRKAVAPGGDKAKAGRA